MPDESLTTPDQFHARLPVGFLRPTDPSTLVQSERAFGGYAFPVRKIQFHREDTAFPLPTAKADATDHPSCERLPLPAIAHTRSHSTPRRGPDPLLCPPTPLEG